jgi:transcriptional regulator with XRE-family HTH domain
MESSRHHGVDGVDGVDRERNLHIHRYRYIRMVATETYSRHLIRTARRNAGLTQVELARRARTSQAAVSAYESGRRSPSVETLCRILAAAGFEVRMRLVEPDRHDATRAIAESLLPTEELDAFNERERRRVSRRRAGTSEASATRV